MSLILTISHVYKSYNGKPILRDCSFPFEKSGTYVLTGSNGCGKSTFLRICALLEEPDGGEVKYFSGTNLFKKDIELRRKITLLLPKVGIFNTTVFKNAAYGLKIRGMRDPEIKEKVERSLEFVGLTHKRNQNALSLSSGDKQKLRIGRGVVFEP